MMYAGIKQVLDDNSRIKEGSHAIYPYPARFSPQFVGSILENFGKVDDVILDPFMGGGTTIVESFRRGYTSVGIDRNPLSLFLARVKTTSLDKSKLSQIRNWIKNDLLGSKRIKGRIELGDRNFKELVPRHLREYIAATLANIHEIQSVSTQNVIRCALLESTRSILESKANYPTRLKFHTQFHNNLLRIAEKLYETTSQSKSVPKKRKKVILQADLRDINGKIIAQKKVDAPSLVITSPPYPGIHILYNKWQIKGRRETKVMYDIINEKDEGSTYTYNLGNRQNKTKIDYFTNITAAFQNLHSILKPGSIVCQLVGFSDIETQLPRYLEVMRQTGFEESMDNQIGSRHVRKVPNRKWHAALKGKTNSSQEFLLIHHRT